MVEFTCDQLHDGDESKRERERERERDEGILEWRKEQGKHNWPQSERKQVRTLTCRLSRFPISPLHFLLRLPTYCAHFFVLKSCHAPESIYLYIFPQRHVYYIRSMRPISRPLPRTPSRATRACSPPPIGPSLTTSWTNT